MLQYSTAKRGRAARACFAGCQVLPRWNYPCGHHGVTSLKSAKQNFVFQGVVLTTFHRAQQNRELLALAARASADWSTLHNLMLLYVPSVVLTLSRIGTRSV